MFDLALWAVGLFALFLWMMLGSSALWFIAFFLSPYIGYKIYEWYQERNKNKLEITLTINGVRQPTPTQAQLDVIALDFEKNYSQESPVAQARARLRETEASEHAQREQLYGTEAQQNADYEIGKLHKQATMLADAGDMIAAVTALQKAQNMTLEASYSYSCLHFTRLPLFMQKAGFYDEALAEVERLAVFFKGYVARGFLHQPPKRIEELYQGYLADLYDKARLLSKRQKDTQKSKDFALLAADALKLSRREQYQ